MIRVHLGAHLLNRDDTGEMSYEVKEICHHRNYTPPHTVMNRLNSLKFCTRKHH